MAGRNREKLEKERESLAKEFPATKDTAILTGDAEDLESLQNIASQTKVLISTSGPFAKIGNKVVEACVVSGTHYCDITGQAEAVLHTFLPCISTLLVVSLRCQQVPQAAACLLLSILVWDTVAHLQYQQWTISNDRRDTCQIEASAAGEAPWVMRMMKAHHAEATRKGVRIVHCCGFDSIPSDLGTLFMVDYMQEKLNR